MTALNTIEAMLMGCRLLGRRPVRVRLPIGWWWRLKTELEETFPLVYEDTRPEAERPPEGALDFDGVRYVASPDDSAMVIEFEPKRLPREAGS